MICYLYILRELFGITKIGISSKGNLKARVRTIQKDLLKYEDIRIRHRFTFPVLFPRILEKWLHVRFKAYRADISKQVSGYTECFDLYVLHRLEVYVYCCLYFFAQVSISFLFIFFSILFLLQNL